MFGGLSAHEEVYPMSKPMSADDAAESAEATVWAIRRNSWRSAFDQASGQQTTHMLAPCLTHCPRQSIPCMRSGKQRRVESIGLCSRQQGLADSQPVVGLGHSPHEAASNVHQHAGGQVEVAVLEVACDPCWQLVALVVPLVARVREHLLAAVMAPAINHPSTQHEKS